MGRVRRDRVLFIALLAVGVLALSLSYALEPTPYQYVRTAGGYLTYRSLRPDRIDESEGQAAYPDDRYAHIPPDSGNPGVRSGIG